MAQRRGARCSRSGRSAAALGGDRARIGPGNEGFAAREVRGDPQEMLCRRRGGRSPSEADATRRRDRAARAVHAGQGHAPKRSARITPKSASPSFGSEEKLPENLPPRHLAIQINNALHDLFCKYPETLLFGEDVAQKGGVYTVTKGLHKAFKSARVFNTLLDETMILGLAQGFANMGMLPVPEIQYLAYFHNACDQIRGEAASLQFFSNDQYRNPMVVRIAGLGYQRGFGGHFHNDNSIAALRDIPGLVVGCPSRGDDAAMMLRTLAALAKVDGRVCDLPRADRAVHDQGSVRAGRWRLAHGLSAAGSGAGARRSARLRRGCAGSRDLHVRQRRADEPARRARDREEARLEDARGRSALAGAAERGADRARMRRPPGASSSSTKAATAPASARA